MVDKYNTPCILHKLPLNSLCIQCRQFRCSQCEDAHIFTSQIIPSWFISKYTALCPTQLLNADELTKIKNALLQNYQSTISRLTVSIRKAIDSMDCYSVLNQTYIECTKQLKSINATTETYDILNGIANKAIGLHTITNESQSLTNNINYFINCIANVEERIGTLTKCVTTKLEFNNQSILHSWKHSQIIIYSIPPQNQSKISLNQCIPTLADSISCSNKIYFIGGGAPISGSCLEYDVHTKQLATKSNLLTNKYGSSLCQCHSIIYSIGGIHEIALSDCEKYIINENKWVYLPNLLTERYYCCALIFSSSYIYTLGGQSNTRKLNSVERIYTIDPLKWESISIYSPFSPRKMLAGMQIRNDEIIIIGSDCPLTCNEFYRYKINGNGIECLSSGKCFNGGHFMSSSSPILDGNYLYAIDHSRCVHIYCIATNSWSKLIAQF